MPVQEPLQQPIQAPSYYYPPYYAPYPPYPPLQPPRDDRIKGTTIVAVVLLLIMIVIPAAVFFVALSSFDQGGTSDVFEGSVTLSEGAHFKVDAGWSPSKVWIFMNVTSGSNVDVYLMNAPQYDGTYGNYTPAVFSATEMWEDEDTLSQACEFQTAGSYNLIVVFDNTDNPLRSSDAVPSGTVELDIHIVSGYIFMD
ncbi:MAG: hypothetical protein V1934_02630 [Methanobacteriota archaeon]